MSTLHPPNVKIMMRMKPRDDNDIPPHDVNIVITMATQTSILNIAVVVHVPKIYEQVVIIAPNNPYLLSPRRHITLAARDLWVHSC
jgi:hypothetical protein